MHYLVYATYITYILFLADYLTTLFGLHLVGKKWEANPLWYKIIDIFGTKGFVFLYPTLLISLILYWNYNIKNEHNNAEIGIFMPIYLYTIYNNIRCIAGIYRKSLHIEYRNQAKPS